MFVAPTFVILTKFEEKLWLKEYVQRKCVTHKGQYRPCQQLVEVIVLVVVCDVILILLHHLLKTKLLDTPTNQRIPKQTVHRIDSVRCEMELTSDRHQPRIFIWLLLLERDYAVV